MTNAPLVCISGGFDPLHNGHIRMIAAAADLGMVAVILNSDEWLIRKKGFYFQSWGQRAEILGAINGVRSVETVNDSDGTVCEALTRIRPDIFGKGGDRTIANTPEVFLCNGLGIKTVFGLGGHNEAHSSLITRQATVNRLWGRYNVIADLGWARVKLLTVEPGKGTSYQLHEKRDEWWFAKEWTGTARRGEWHQLQNHGDKPLDVLEVQYGEPIEGDIVRSEK